MAMISICSMCGQPIMEADHMEGYHGQLKSWEPLHEKCAEALNELAKRSGKAGPALRDGFAGAPDPSGGRI